MLNGECVHQVNYCRASIYFVCPPKPNGKKPLAQETHGSIHGATRVETRTEPVFLAGLVMRRRSACILVEPPRLVCTILAGTFGNGRAAITGPTHTIRWTGATGKTPKESGLFAVERGRASGESRDASIEVKAPRTDAMIWWASELSLLQRAARFKSCRLKDTRPGLACTDSRPTPRPLSPFRCGQGWRRPLGHLLR